MRDRNVEIRSRWDDEAPQVRAAEYVRMSTDQQRYSATAQSEAIHRYAAERGIQIVRRYEDAGKSGLNIAGRSALSQLISDVQSGQAGYEVVIVFDVSRWGRFQDSDESAYYEYICKQNGVHVEYCAEQFINDGSPLSAVIKGMKRAMAGEYSRELSAKVYAGQTRLIRQGFRQGGKAGYGLRRTLLAEDGSVKCQLKDGDRKSLLSERVVLTPGTPDELAVIAEIYRMFVSDEMTRQGIADDLNRRGIPFSQPGGWTRPRVSRILSNVAYVGDSLWGRTSGKLRRKRVRTSPENWIYAPDVFQPIIERALFDQAQTIIESKTCKLTNPELLRLLAGLFDKHGTLSVSTGAQN